MAAVRRSSASTRNRVFRRSSRSSLPRSARHGVGHGGVVVQRRRTRCSSCRRRCPPRTRAVRGPRSLAAESISSRISSQVSSSSSESTSAASSGDISSMMSAAFSGSRDSRMLACILGSSTSESASAATSLSMVSKMASRSAGPSSSTMSARSAGCIVLELGVGDVQAQAALRVGLHHVGKTPSGWSWAEWRAAGGGSSGAAARPATRAGRCCGCRYRLPAR